MSIFALYRIIGNDLPPRHSEGQSMRNVRFILEHEKAFDECAKMWVVNRIRCPEREAAILALLAEFGQSFIIIPFVLAEYAQVGWDTGSEGAWSFSERFVDEAGRLRAEQRVRRLKINYLMNVNGARNVALRDGRRRARWVLPWDGNCFMHEAAWEAMLEAVLGSADARYCVVPMARLLSNKQALRRSTAIMAIEEPQIAFHRYASEEFDERYPYGHRSKVELLQRLGVPGPWDARADAWDMEPKTLAMDAGRFVVAGWVCRLDSGHPEQERGPSSLMQRSLARRVAIISAADEADRDVLASSWDPARLTSYDSALLAQVVPAGRLHEIGRRLACDAEAALSRGVYSVVDKLARPPSGDPHDYWSPAPYWWPDSARTGAMVWHDGEIATAAVLYGKGNEHFDRTRLQRLFDETTVLALAWRASADRRFAEHGARLVRTWFVDPTTRMTPHLRYAQVKAAADPAEVNHHGIIEMKDIYYFLDAVRILDESGSLTASDLTSLRAWLAAYLRWLTTSRAGRLECHTLNNHGIYFDLQVGAIAAYVGDLTALTGVLRRFYQRLPGHFQPDGSQPHELVRTRPAHYSLFNIQGWINTATLLHRHGFCLWNHSTEDGRCLRTGIERTLSVAERSTGPAELVDPCRLLPLRLALSRHFHRSTPPIITRDMLEHALLHPYYGTKPYWFL